MCVLGLKIKTQSPLLLSAAPPARNILETLDFIPGNTIRGLLARRYMDQGGNPKDEIFQRLFLTKETLFGFAYINGASPIPLSARTCKYYGGFVGDNGHGVIDLLLSENLGIRCGKPGCRYPIARIEGYYSTSDHKKIDVGKRLITRTAIDSTRGSAKSGQLYSQRILEEQQCFLANIVAPEELKEPIESLLDSPFIAGIGKGRSRGQGWVQVEKHNPLTLLLSPSSAKERFERFMDKGLAVTLLSDSIFHDEYFRDCTAPSSLHLKGMGIMPGDWEPEPSMAFADTRLVFGFDGPPLQLPRPARLAVKAGSVFFFRPNGHRKPTVPMGSGIGWIGDKNSEGFGLAVLCHPFHYLPDKGGTNE